MRPTGHTLDNSELYWWSNDNSSSQLQENINERVISSRNSYFQIYLETQYPAQTQHQITGLLQEGEIFVDPRRSLLAYRPIIWVIATFHDLLQLPKSLCPLNHLYPSFKTHFTFSLSQILHQQRNESNGFNNPITALDTIRSYGIYPFLIRISFARGFFCNVLIDSNCHLKFKIESVSWFDIQLSDFSTKHWRAVRRLITGLTDKLYIQ